MGRILRGLMRGSGALLACAPIVLSAQEDVSSESFFSLDVLVIIIPSFMALLLTLFSTYMYTKVRGLQMEIERRDEVLRCAREEAEQEKRAITDELARTKQELIEQIERLRERCEKHEKTITSLRQAQNVNVFDGLLPICSRCKDIRDAEGVWHQFEEYIAKLSEADFSHSLCPDCSRQLYPELFEGGKKLHCITWK
ncbi:MAG: hypothetical protein A2X49_13080 [Lentisphaerae bacterium GWF2_52_8]|nr:MAG: hypothetical protein A2X49_13080 [Lentisphaerae bacterium GWF2_52_8]